MHYIIRAVMTTLTMFIFFVSKNDMNEDRQRTTNRRVPENEQKQNSVNYYVYFVVTKISKKIYASHVELLTESWKKMALKLGELDIYSKLCVGDLRANEVFYHKHHYVAFRNRYHASFVDKEEADEKCMNTVLECYALKQIIIYMRQSLETYMDATELEKKYQNLLESYNIPYSPHITRFIEKLKQKEPDLNDHTLHRKKSLSFKKQTSVEAPKTEYCFRYDDETCQVHPIKDDKYQAYF